MAELKEGSRAPDFTLLNDAGEKVKLSSFAEKTVVLYFYPRADTPGCTKEAYSFRDRHAEILAERPNQMWGIDATVGFTVADGRVAIFAMVDHATAESRAFPSPSAAQGLRRWDRSARRCVNSSVVLQKTSLAASDSGMITARNS